MNFRLVFFGWLFFFSIVTVSQASAIWLHQKGEDNPFAGGSEHIAMVMGSSGFVAGFKCVQSADLTVMMVTTEKPDMQTAAVLSALSAKLLVIVDDNPKIALKAEIDITADRERYRISAKGPEVARLLHMVASARKRFALAGEIGGKIVWTTVFEVAGSRRAIQPLIDGCHVENS